MDITVRDYHERTKHSLQAYAKGPQYLDWDQQPNPFRRFAGADVVELPFYSPPSPPLPPQGGQGVRKGGITAIAALLELSLGLSAWKQFGPDRWSLRCNPSSGNLHPTEGYIVATGIEGLGDGVYHYAPHEHALELRGKITPNPDSHPQCLLGLSSVAWREAWKYGERAFRYVQLDAGHALGAIRYAAAALGLQVELLAVTDAEIATLLGLNRAEDFAGAEAEHPDMLLRIHAGDAERPALPTANTWYGRANQLGGHPSLQWPVIDAVTAAAVCETRKEPGLTLPPSAAAPQPELIPLIRQRRSAQAFSGKQSTLSADTFFHMLQALLPEAGMPWDVWGSLPVRLHPVFFVHRVEGLPPGLYALPRRPDATALLQAAMNPDFRWRPPPDCPDDLPLYQLLEADARKAARTLSCHQDIASTSAFSLGMLAEFDAGLADGAHVYRQLYWEAGLLGQVLYLQAEAIGMRGTGIGCFFDDDVHQVLGLHGTQFQSLYHFTVGSPQVDTRLETLPPYAHLPTERFHHG
ncbi:SagB/ThcOx family dehydrogenase [Candidatus Thiothrix sp. Deng01]|uniref:SagB/ThcOx family dehydrogenase n=1 Tax=Candidatus Thiothrix phosphatis TaxID=3112415 RepID=A0ABU6D2F3_9GAMM|nr:SagB/ThcOx family dehydrogenase [Candidatus Thiothrix sp. Deng01]MEB4593195.1 SagB/ThcOx family dehydrogenase [Candidatus Thiothrix sp. Deng01]